ncbi:MAG: patatin-like phospholipase family protein [Pirellulales bacterium]
MNALVLSGGSVKGAFQAGALPVVFSKGYVPEYIWGVSIGALNGAFLVDRAGRAASTGLTPNWHHIGDDLKTFWQTNVTKPDDLVTKRIFPLVPSLWGSFNGLLDTTKLQTLVRRTLDEKYLVQSPCGYAAGVVDLIEGSYFNADLTTAKLLDHIIASTSIPVTMPLVKQGTTWLADGGVRDIAPLRHAIDADASRIVVIACQAKKLEAKTFNPGNPVALLERVIEILTDEILQNDLTTLEWINLHCPKSGTPVASGPFKGKRYIPTTVIRPEKNLVIDITKFTSADISQLIKEGEAAAKKASLP